MTATILSFLVAALYSQRVAAALDNNAVSIATNASLAIDHLARARDAVRYIQLASIDAVQEKARGSSVDPSYVSSAVSHLHEALAAYTAIPFYPQEQQQFSEVRTAVVELDRSTGDLISHLRAYDGGAAQRILSTRIGPAVQRADDAIHSLVDFNVEQERRLSMDIPALRRRAARLGYILDGVTALLSLGTMFLVVRAERAYVEALELGKRESERRSEILAATSTRIEHVIESAIRISDHVAGDNALREILDAVAEEARLAVNADYCALGYGTDPDRPFDPWAFATSSSYAAAAIGRPPLPVGLVGAVVREGRAIRVDDLETDPAFQGLPGPPMGPFMGVPLPKDRQPLGSLYFARGKGTAPFNYVDQYIVEVLASFVGVAIDCARSYRDIRANLAARDDLLAGVSHDLKSPLTVVRLAATLLSATAKEDDVADLSKRIQRSVDGMAHLVDDLLRDVKIDAGVIQPTRTLEDAASLVQEAAESFRLVAAGKDVELLAQTPEIPLTVSCDRGLIVRTLSNLVGNALKFTPHGGAVRVRAGRRDDEALFSVADTGPGIPEADLPNVFDRYWSSSKSAAGGSGLGLHIAKGIVTAHGGRIWIESTSVKGTTVCFALSLSNAGHGSPEGELSMHTLEP
jgi:signal transduction histidine kinase